MPCEDRRPGGWKWQVCKLELEHEGNHRYQSFSWPRLTVQDHPLFLMPTDGRIH